ncbi:PorT family protein [Flavobacterium psychroterrae]|jgi:opacity protein-like surface antigen|uniref:PorT family protein n=1 Tax=Flavobacterium psychroterrae TaxID=2133767 RepID=A0ABS5PF22_9FLAO|nr:porin family protein [Flavobacterium psychroterrae]MBS7232296.1 PorT family protein [Flavobacterium psychroterrae]
MKKVLLSAVAVMAFMSVSAQETRFGVKAGANLSTFGGDAEDAKSLVGFQVGGFAEIKLTDKFAIQPEILFSTQGAKSEESGLGYSYEDKILLSYLNIPVMAKYYVAEKFSVEAGPQIGFLLSAKDKYEFSDNGMSDSGKQDVKDNYESIDFGVNFGAGYDFTENLSVGLRYNLGLSNIAKTEDGEDFKMNNSVFSLSVGYKF